MAVTVDGCQSRSATVRTRRKIVVLSVRLTCPRGTFRLTGTIRGFRLDGVLSRSSKRRHFAARLTVPKGVVLKGKRGTRALTVVGNVDRLVRHGPSEISRVGTLEVARTEIDLLLSRRARVADVNAALASVGGRIMGSVKGSPLVAVCIPDPGDLRTLDKLRAMLAKMPGVLGAERGVLPAPDDLPSAFISPPSPGQLTATQHLLALRMPAAWNARAALMLSQRPLLVVLDDFGAGPLNPHVDAVNSGSVTRVGTFSNHGYHVVGIAAADFADDGTPQGLVTGVFPATTDLYTIDRVQLTPIEGFIALELEALSARHSHTHLVVNTSQNFLGYPNSMILAAAESWTALVHNNALDTRLVQASSAGNQSVNAVLNSAWNASVLASPLLDPATGRAMSSLKQTLVVEDLDSSGAPAFDPGCIDSFSDTHGNIAAVGEGVYSMLAGPFAGQLSGTSMSTPQMAGLAEYLWSIAPDLTAQEITQAIIQTAPHRTLCQSAPPADAYAATLSLDQPGPPSKANTPVRLAILDDNGDGKFDETDVIALARSVVTASNPTTRDWSRADLNGDGFTGGATTAPFDLDTAGSLRAGAPHLGPVTETIQGVPVSFDESSLTDTQILCYYAYSPLYTGSASIRDATLAGKCSASIYWSNTVGSGLSTHDEISRANADGSGVNPAFITSPLSGSQGGIEGLGVDAQHVYWANAGNGTIGRANIDGSGANSSFITTSGCCITGLTIDAQHVYWTSLSGFIGRANLDGSGVDTTFIAGTTNPRGIAVDAGHVYWSDIGGSPTDSTIGRANIDGSGVNPNFITFLTDPYGLAVDGSHIYWGDMIRSKVGRANLDGSGVDPNFIVSVGGPFGVAVDDAHVYWTNQSTGTIGRASLDGSSVNQSFIAATGDGAAAITVR